MQEDEIQVGLVVHFIATELAVTDYCELCLSSCTVFSAFGLAVLLLQRLVCQLVNRFEYHLGEEHFGPRAPVDLVLAEMNRAALLATLPDGRKAGGFFTARPPVPARQLVLDLFVDDDLFQGQTPLLQIHDKPVHERPALRERSEDPTQLDLAESIAPLGGGLAGARLADSPSYHPLLDHVLRTVGWDPARMRGYRCAIEFPVYGSETVLQVPAR